MREASASRLRRALSPRSLRRIGVRCQTKIVRPLRRDGLEDLAHILAAPSVRTVLDVGVHVGNMSADFLRTFPAAQVIGVEADERSTRQLRQRLGGEPRFELIEAAAAAVDGERLAFYALPVGGTSSLQRPLDDGAQAGAELVEVPTVTIDALCEARGITTVDVLKVDVEGAEIEVLRGAEHLLSTSSIRAIFAEARFVRETEGGVLLHELAAFLAPLGYRMHNLYDQVESAARGTIYANAIFLGAAEEAALAARTNDRIFVQRLARVVDDGH